LARKDVCDLKGSSRGRVNKWLGEAEPAQQTASIEANITTQ
jgi:hypothetical protein